MSKNSDYRIVRRTAEEIVPTSPEELARLKAIPDEAIDYSDIPERTGGRRLRRDPDGRLPARRSLIREAISTAMAEREMTTYSLWKESRIHCSTISETAIGEFLKGERSIGLEYLEAIMTVLDLAVMSR